MVQDTNLHATNLTSGRLLAGNAFWNLVGICSPALIAVFCLPALKHTLGTDRLGLLTLAWVLIGYFGLFDFGVSRALTKAVAEKLGQQQTADVPPLISTSLLFLALVGGATALGVLAISHWIVQDLLKMPSALRSEALGSFYWLSGSIPLVMLSAGARGVLEAFQKFRLATAIRIPMGIFTYLGPVLVLPFSHNLVTVIAVLVFGRAVACAAHIWACFLIVPHLKGRHFLPFRELKPLLRFGAWLTVSNVVGPMMVAFDRFLIGAMVSVSAVAYYAVPSEVVLKLSLIPAALVGVLFPAFSTASRADRARLVFLYECGVKYTFIVLFSLTIILIAFAPEGLRLWLGSDFALNSTSVARWLAAAIFINAIAQIPYAHIQSVGRADLTAKLHLIELPLYAAALFLMASKMGIQGVAIAWFGRAALDAVLLFFLSHRLLPENEIVVSKLPWMLATALMAFVVAASNEPLGFRMAFVLGTCVVAALIAWFRVLSPRERIGMQVLFQRLYVSKPINPAENG